VKEGIAADLPWTDIAIAFESAIAIVVTAADRITCSPSPSCRDHD
jgi:6-phosphofructokinase